MHASTDAHRPIANADLPLYINVAVAAARSIFSRRSNRLDLGCWVLAPTNMHAVMQARHAGVCCFVFAKLRASTLSLGITGQRASRQAPGNTRRPWPLLAASFCRPSVARRMRMQIHRTDARQCRVAVGPSFARGDMNSGSDREAPTFWECDFSVEISAGDNPPDHEFMMNIE
jgi:hypothetical protein